MNRLAALALTVAMMFLIVMAVLVNSPPLFYMATAVAATLFGSRLQAWFAVRWLKFEREPLPAVSLGETVNISTTVWSQRRILRPLVSVYDELPPRLAVRDRTPPLPVAPAFDQPIQTRFSFRPMRRGRYNWSRVRAITSDALGLVTIERTYSIEPVELTVHPTPFPVSVDVRPSAGWGVAELETGRAKGPGLEPAAIREYSPGDPLRYIHWKSSAKTGKIMVKEFDAGSGVRLLLWLQRTVGTEVGSGGFSSFEAMCGHALFLADTYLERGAGVVLPQFEAVEQDERAHPESRVRKIRDLLTDAQPTSMVGVGQEAAPFTGRSGTTHLFFLVAQDEAVPQFSLANPDCSIVCLIYDAEDYREGAPLPSGLRPASDPLYLSRLEAAGATVEMMPKVEPPG